MFAGHMAAAWAARRVAPGVSPGWLMAAALLPDLVWPVLVLAGVEQVMIHPGATAFTPLVFPWYPWSHGLAAAVVLGGALAWVAARQQARARLVLVGLAVSHWVLDVVTHAPDMPLWPGSPRIGLGLWNSIPATLAVEGALWAGAVGWYWRAARPRAAAYWSLVALVTVAWAGSPFGPPPPSVEAVAGVTLALWLVPFWAAAAGGDLQARPSSATLIKLQ